MEFIENSNESDEVYLNAIYAAGYNYFTPEEVMVGIKKE